MKTFKLILILVSILALETTSECYANLDKKSEIKINQNSYSFFYEYKKNCVNKIFNIQLKKLIDENEFFKAEMSYPLLKIKSKYECKEKCSTKVIEDINKDIQKYIISFYNEIKEESAKYKHQYKNIFSNSKEKYVKYQYEAYSDYQVSYNKNNLISIPIKLYEFTGGAHGMSYLKSFNYDLLTGKEIKLKDMFKQDVDYKELINKYIKNEIQKNQDIYFKGDDGFKGINDNQSFYIDDDGIVVYFSLYEIAPYYVGIPKFKITWDEFGEYLNYNK